MSDYGDYNAALIALNAAINEADHAGAQVSREHNAAAAAAEQKQAANIASLQQLVQRATRDYATMAARVRNAEGIGIDPPARVRPAAGGESVRAALVSQQTAATALARDLIDYEIARQAAQKSISLPSIPEPQASGWFERLLASLLRLFKSSARLKSARKGLVNAEHLTHATERGTISGYEPEALKGITIPDLPMVYGEPGSGLANSGFSDSAVKLGQKGEINFARSLVKAGLIEHFAIFWSIHMLSKDTYGKVESDVDCAVITGNTIWLIDLKYYTGGNVIYKQQGENQLACWDVPTGRQIGGVRKMSQNMKMAVERFGSRYSNYKTLRVEARVVFVPTAAGVGRIEDVRWPGDIPAMMLPDFLAELANESPFHETVESDLVRRTFERLVKN